MFHDRLEAGKLLAQRLTAFKGRNAIVLGIPRGGVEVAYVIAKALDSMLGLAIAKKIPSPANPELAIGAVAFGGVLSLDKDRIESHFISLDYVKAEAGRLEGEIKRRYAAFNSSAPDVKNRIVIIVDDGMATGHTVMAAVQAVKKQHPSRLIVAVPVASMEALEMVKPEADEVICLEVPELFMAVGEFYRDFPQLSDADVIRYLKEL